MLVLFDIDATLLKSGGAGFRSMVDAGQELFGPAFQDPGIDYSGRLDPLIIGELLSHNGQEPTPAARQRFRETYARRLASRLTTDRAACEALHGVHDLVDAPEREHVRGLHMGILTGNFPETGSLKLRHAGLDPARFLVHVWGSDGNSDPPTRDDLPRVALTRWRPAQGEPCGSRVTIIGDTPHDVQCALVNGCRALAVATGRHTLDELRTAGAHHTVPHLGETRLLVDWILSNAGSA